MNLGSKVRSLSLACLFNIHAPKVTPRKINVYKATAVEKSRLIILCRKVNLYSLPAAGIKIGLPYKKVMPYITQA